MSKKIIDQDGQTYVAKKPFYKRVWFWIIAILAIFIIGGAAGGSKNASNDSAKESSSSKSVESKPKGTAQQIAALNSAKNYASIMHMSKQGIHDQLVSSAGDKFSEADAQYAVNNLTDVDWNKNALEAAKNYQSTMNMSKDAILGQLTSSAGDKFTQEQAQYAVDHLDK